MIKTVITTASAVLLMAGAASAQTMSPMSGIPGTVVTITAPAGTYPAGNSVSLGGNAASNISSSTSGTNQIFTFTVPAIEPGLPFGVSVNGV